MKALSLFLSMLLTAAAFADELKDAKTVDLYDVTEKPAAFEGQVVKLKFGWRDGDKLAVYHKGSKTGKIAAVVPAEGKGWFDGLTTKVFSQPGITVFARITGGKAELLGKEIKVEATGTKAVW